VSLKFFVSLNLIILLVGLPVLAKESRPPGRTILTPCQLLLAVIRYAVFTKRSVRQNLPRGASIPSKVNLISNSLKVFIVEVN
jgi:hypothetical protein